MHEELLLTRVATSLLTRVTFMTRGPVVSGAEVMTAPVAWPTLR